ncbi:hypothetical protein HI914_07498 [Erysiphe necator]|nr:hypothetical protein HI914_07498 [Erysiphe necator]
MLGLPWLHIVNAVIDVKNSSITISDEGIGEERVIIETPRFTTSKYHTLTLYSTDSKYKKQIETVEKKLELRSENMTNDHLDTVNTASNPLEPNLITKIASTKHVSWAKKPHKEDLDDYSSDSEVNSEDSDYSSEYSKKLESPRQDNKLLQFHNNYHSNISTKLPYFNTDTDVASAKPADRISQ